MQDPGGRDARAKRCAQVKQEERSKLREKAQQGKLSTAERLKVYRADVQDAGGRDALAKMRAQMKAQARARVLAKTKRGTFDTEQDARNMATQVLAKLAEPDMKKKCLASIASGPNRVQVWAEAIRKYETERKKSAKNSKKLAASTWTVMETNTPPTQRELVV